MTPEERAQYEQLLERIKRLEAAAVDKQIQINNLRTMLKMTCNNFDRQQAYVDGIRKRLDRLDDVRDRSYATGSRGSWMVG